MIQYCGANCQTVIFSSILLLDKYHNLPYIIHNGPLAQLDRATDFYSVGRAFKSLRDRHLHTKGNRMANVADKLTKVNESFTINMYDNGYMVEVGGRDAEDEWKTSKIICATLDEVIAIVRKVAEMPRND